MEDGVGAVPLEVAANGLDRGGERLREGFSGKRETCQGEDRLVEAKQHVLHELLDAGVAVAVVDEAAHGPERLLELVDAHVGLQAARADVDEAERVGAQLRGERVELGRAGRVHNGRVAGNVVEDEGHARAVLPGRSAREAQVDGTAVRGRDAYGNVPGRDEDRGALDVLRPVVPGDGTRGLCRLGGRVAVVPEVDGDDDICAVGACDCDSTPGEGEEAGRRPDGINALGRLRLRNIAHDHARDDGDVVHEGARVPSLRDAPARLVDENPLGAVERAEVRLRRRNGAAVKDRAVRKDGTDIPRPRASRDGVAQRRSRGVLCGVEAVLVAEHDDELGEELAGRREYVLAALIKRREVGSPRLGRNGHLVHPGPPEAALPRGHRVQTVAKVGACDGRDPCEDVEEGQGVFAENRGLARRSGGGVTDAVALVVVRLYRRNAEHGVEGHARRVAAVAVRHDEGDGLSAGEEGAHGGGECRDVVGGGGLQSDDEKVWVCGEAVGKGRSVAGAGSVDDGARVPCEDPAAGVG